jgi:hypothetical protein
MVVFSQEELAKQLSMVISKYDSNYSMDDYFIKLQEFASRLANEGMGITPNFITEAFIENLILSLELPRDKEKELKDLIMSLVPRTADSFYVFLSYARLDKAYVKNIYLEIKNEGFKPWMDIHNIKGGENWLRAITKAIDESDIFLAILSNNSVSRRGAIQKELKKALDKWEGMLLDDIYIIPLRIDDCPIPELLKDLHVIDWEDGKGKNKLLEAIQVGLERRRG